MKKIRYWPALLLAVFSLTLVAGIGPAMAATTTYFSTDVPKDIVDVSTVTSLISVPCAAMITDVNVQLDITHTYDGDLILTLIAPDGTSILLANQRGGGGDNYSGTIFDDEAATAIGAGTAPFAGSYQPEAPLSGLDGRGTEGDWTLQIEDLWPGDEGVLNSWSLTVTTDDGKLASTDIPKALPDLATTTSTITSCNTGQILDLNVQLDIAHPYDADLDIFLIAPDGTRVELSTDNGISGDNYSGTIFDDEAATAITAGTAPFTGSYRPESPLAVLDNTGANGLWTLEIADDAGLDTGTLNAWRLIFTTLAPGYTVSTYVSGLPAIPAGLTVDPRTRTFYYADYDNCNGVLRKIAPDRTVSMVTADFTPNGDVGCGGNFYPYMQTDIQFLNGSVFVPLAEDALNSNGELVQINTSTGATASQHNFTGFGVESGIAARGGNLLVTSGAGTASEIRSYNPVSKTSAAVLDVSPLPSVYNVEYDPTQDATYFWSGNVFYQADLGAGTYAAIPGYVSGYADFAVSPDGNFLFTASNSSIEVVTIADGSSENVYAGLTDPTRHDMVLAPSTAGGGCSLYVADGTNILEFSGFPGSCKAFPWIMFLPAITNR